MRKVLNNWLRIAALAVAFIAMGADVSLAQVTVSVNDISGRPGESASIWDGEVIHVRQRQRCFGSSNGAAALEDAFRGLGKANRDAESR